MVREHGIDILGTVEASVHDKLNNFFTSLVVQKKNYFSAVDMVRYYVAKKSVDFARNKIIRALCNSDRFEWLICKLMIYVYFSLFHGTFCIGY